MSLIFLYIKLSDEFIQYLAVNWRAAVPMKLLTSWEQIFQGEEVDIELVKVFWEYDIIIWNIRFGKY